MALNQNHVSLENRKAFAGLKNLLLGQAFLRDNYFFEEALGKQDFVFWNHIQEKEPYLLTHPKPKLDAITKGKIILERIEAETSPKRLADLLQGCYLTLAFLSNVPKEEYDGLWRRFTRELGHAVYQSGFSEMKLQWLKEPEVHYTNYDAYSTPGDFQITYTGRDWGEHETIRVLAQGFKSKILQQMANEKPRTAAILNEGSDNTFIDISSVGFDVGIHNKGKRALVVGGKHTGTRVETRNWHQTWWGILFLTVIGGLVIAGITYKIGW